MGGSSSCTATVNANGAWGFPKCPSYDSGGNCQTGCALGGCPDGWTEKCSNGIDIDGEECLFSKNEHCWIQKTHEAGHESILDANTKQIMYSAECDNYGNREEYLGTFDTARECYAKCVDVKGDDCRFFVFGKNNRHGGCFWEAECLFYKPAINYNLYYHETSNVYELMKGGVECIGGTEEYLGTFNTAYECYSKCKQDKGDSCIYFDYGVRSGGCFWESKCYDCTVNHNYNVFVVKGNADAKKYTCYDMGYSPGFGVLGIGLENHDYWAVIFAIWIFALVLCVWIVCLCLRVIPIMKGKRENSHKNEIIVTYG
eukprot:226625_1